MVDYNQIICKFYPEDNDLRRLLLFHSRQVVDRCLQIIKLHPELHLDASFVETAAMLHDIGIFKTHAPSIFCTGTLDYLCHGYVGGELLRELNLPDLARVCERHTGAGLTAAEIASRNIPIPVADYLPETLSEQLVCYADKFYSKSKPLRVKTPEQALASVAKFGEEGAARFNKWMKCFE